jgi:hypothetical protein
LIVASAWGVVDTKMAVTTAAEEAARTYVESSDPTSAASQAQEAAAQVLAGFGRAPSRATMTVSGGSFGRCQRVTIEVRYPSPVLDLPFVGPVGSGLAVTAEHSELIDPYRSGLSGSSLCG